MMRGAYVLNVRGVKPDGLATTCGATPKRFRRCHGSARRHANGTSLHSWIDSLSSGSVHACCHACDEAERKKFEMFHKVLRQLNITNISSLQAFPSLLKSPLRLDAELSLQKSTCQVAICNLKFIILKPLAGLAQLVERLNGIAVGRLLTYMSTGSFCSLLPMMIASDIVEV